MVVRMIAAALAATMALVAGQDTYPSTFVGQAPQLPALPAERWIDTETLLGAVDPLPPPSGYMDCYYDFCGSPGGFIDSVLGRCNVSLTQTNLNYAMTAASAKKILTDCLCGKTDDDFITIVSMWQGCASCLASSGDFVRSTNLTWTSYSDACQCAQPGPIEALMNLGNPKFRCSQVVRRATGSRIRGVNPTATSSTTASSSSATASSSALLHFPVVTQRPAPGSVERESVGPDQQDPRPPASPQLWQDRDPDDDDAARVGRVPLTWSD